MTVRDNPHDQALQALAVANARRDAVSQLRRDIGDLPGRDGRQLAAGLLAEPTDVVQAMRVYVLLISVRRVGETTARRWLRRVGATSPEKKVRELSERQRYQLAEILQAGDR